MEAELDLTVRFQEPTVGGLTGQQLSLLRQWDDERRCEFEFFPVSPKGPEERCIETKVDGSRFCEDHIPEDDDYDSYQDLEFDWKNE